MTQLGERLAEQIVAALHIDSAFKLYYLDDEGDAMLVSAHTGLRDLLTSEQLTARLDAGAPAAAYGGTRSGSGGAGRAREAGGAALGGAV